MNTKPKNKQLTKQSVKERVRQVKAKDRLTTKKYNPSWG